MGAARATTQGTIRQMRNLEFKARVQDHDAVRARALGLGARPAGDLHQVDTYFAVPSGRLKLRQTTGKEAELIAYSRAEDDFVRASDYHLARIPDGDSLVAVLKGALGVLAVVRKKRELFLLDGTRIHLDSVENLGSFMEIEVPVEADDSSAQSTIDSLIQTLGLSADQGIRGSYLDITLTQVSP